MFNLRLSRPIGLLPFLFPFRSAFRPPPVLHRWRRGLATTRRPRATAFGPPPVLHRWRRGLATTRRPRATAFRPPPAQGRCCAKGKKERMGDEVRVIVFKPGSHRCRTGGEPNIRGGEEGKSGGWAARIVTKPGSHRCRTGGGQRAEREAFRATSHGTETGMRENAKSGQNATN